MNDLEKLISYIKKMQGCTYVNGIVASEHEIYKSDSVFVKFMQTFWPER